MLHNAHRIKQGEENSLNIGRVRNIGNMNKNEYNCGGYALGLFGWHLPFESAKEMNELREKEGWFYEGWNDKEKASEIATANIVEEMQGRARVIEGLCELKENEYPVVMRFSDTDFHFVKRTKANRWLHKRGRRHKIETMPREEVFCVEGWNANDEYRQDNIYNTKPVIFAVLN